MPRALRIAGSVALGTLLFLAAYSAFLAVSLHRPSGHTLVAVPQPASAGGGSTVAAIGDSLSLGYLSDDGKRFYLDARNSIPGTAAAKIGGRFIDLAIDGANCVQSFSGDGEHRAPAISRVASIPRNTRAVIVNCGTNDTMRHVESNGDFDAVVGAVRRRVPRAALVIVTVRVTPLATAASVRSWNANEKAVAARTHASIVDLESQPQGEGPYWPDGIHPSKATAVEIGNAVGNLLRRR